VALLVAVGFQSAFVVDYARRSDFLVRSFLQAKPHLGRDQRVGSLLLDVRGPFRANPLLHVDCLLGVDTGNIIWSNYETANYYFPVQLRPDVRHPPVPVFEAVAILDRPEESAQRAALWNRLLQDHHRRMGMLVVWGRDARLDELNARLYEPVFQEGNVRVLRHLPTPVDLPAPRSSVRRRGRGRASPWGLP
jgi:hypothetical protein